MRELSRRFPEATLVTRPRLDNSDPGEIMIEVLNAPSRPPRAVEEFARRWIWKLWGDEPWPAAVCGINAEDTLKYHAADLARAQRGRPSRRRRTPPKRRRTTAR